MKYRFNKDQGSLRKLYSKACGLSFQSIQVVKTLSEEIFGFYIVSEIENEENHSNYEYLKIVYENLIWIKDSSSFVDFKLRRNIVEEFKYRGKLQSNPDEDYKLNYRNRLAFELMEEQKQNNKSNKESLSMKRKIKYKAKKKQKAKENVR